MAAFFDFWTKSIWDKSQSLAQTSRKTEKIKALVLYQLLKVPLLFQNIYSLVTKIEICLKYFLDKVFQKQPLWVWEVRPEKIPQVREIYSEHQCNVL